MRGSTAELKLRYRAVGSAHFPSTLGEHYAAVACSPLFEGSAVRAPEPPKLRHHFEEDGFLAPSNSKGRISTTKRLEARGAPIGRKPPHTLRPQYALTMRSHPLTG